MLKGFWVRSGWGYRFSMVCVLNIVVLTGGYAWLSRYLAGGIPTFQGILAMAGGIFLASGTVALAAYRTFVFPLRQITEAMDDLVTRRRSMIDKLPGVHLAGDLGCLI